MFMYLAFLNEAEAVILSHCKTGEGMMAPPPVTVQLNYLMVKYFSGTSTSVEPMYQPGSPIT